MDTLASRDIEANPYTPCEQRVAEYIFNHGIGGGDDPIGFILASHAYVVNQRNLLPLG
jgi:hypothetical protein